MNNLQTSVRYIKGIGPKREKLLAKLGLITVRDLLFYLPRRYINRTIIMSIASVLPPCEVTIKGKVLARDVKRLSKSLTLFKAAISDGTGIAYCVFFRKAGLYQKHNPFDGLLKDFEVGQDVLVYGSCGFTQGEKQVSVIEYAPCIDQQKQKDFLGIIPVYPLSDGVSSKLMRDVIKQITPAVASVQETLPSKILNENSLMGIKDALHQIHFPESELNAEDARKRLAFDEVLSMLLALGQFKKNVESVPKIHNYELKKTLLTKFKEKLKFNFTLAQKKAINQIFADMLSKRPMNRLLVGDVGCGKTVVALSAMLLAIENGNKAALLAPTEILAQQHKLTIDSMLNGLGVKSVLLTSASLGSTKKRAQLMEEINSGGADIIIGTHAILEGNVEIPKLSMAVIDEQHRFGVMQRSTMRKKGSTIDMLVMSATPIPRTVALTLYADLDLTIIDQMPPGRIPIATYNLNPQSAYEVVIKELAAGRQAYIVYPLIEETEKLDLKAAIKEYEKLSKTLFVKYKTALLHGQLSADEKQAVMDSFKANKTQLLFCTTVIEVGIDVPNATVMVIEHAERFGLATLHQLRGRVGRGKDKSYCLLISKAKTDDARRRIKIMLSTNDGFVIAQEDFKLRGFGELFGTLQHGSPVFSALNPFTDSAIIELAKNISVSILISQSWESGKEYSVLRNRVFSLYAQKLELPKIG
ncbi:MAG: ATP-dependent DNA helicase RecG [Endomicrobiales bacterium]|nr:ATP-dependent DNA helicase RecG [Endomicrobiales bacterium]